MIACVAIRTETVHTQFSYVNHEQKQELVKKKTK